MILAAIDIGSNAARLLINEVKLIKPGKPEFIKLNLLRIPLRLGMDVFTKGKIGKERKEMLVNSMQVFSALMKIYNTEEYRACATSAMRDAKNGEEIIKEIKKKTGIGIEIISGDEEATMVFESGIAEEMEETFSYLYIDVGGGSTEITLYENGKMIYEKSFNIGTIRLLDSLIKESQWKEMKIELKAKIDNKKELVAIGAGGNINKIFSMSKTKDGKPISSQFLKALYKEASQLTVEERMVKYNIREDRADVMIPALEIYNKILGWTKITKIFVPKISVADGLIHHIYNGLKNKKVK